MGLKLRLCLFQGVDERQVERACQIYYSKKGRRLVDSGDEFFRYHLHQQDQGWVFASPIWRSFWIERRQAFDHDKARSGLKQRTSSVVLAKKDRNTMKNL
ncbi:MAG: hypothetical protein C5B50_17370 [Verrucomicrobia bacterium]|nr:MAG: hypothetical protein C5B50_17370 [Verrucomicrobiota bacterium]